MTENAVNQIVENKGFNNFDIGDMVIDTVIGGISGIGEPVKEAKHLTKLGKQTVKRTFNTTKNKGVKTGMREAKRHLPIIEKIHASTIMNFGKVLVGMSFLLA